MPSLRQLRYFAALARHRHFGKAAQDCAVSQPALSVQIQELEAQLGAKLVERRRNEIHLTSAGLEIERRARDILAAVRDMEDYIQQQNQALSGPLRLGVIPSIAPYLLPTALPRLRQNFPKLDLQLRETITETLILELVDGKLDLLLLSLPVAHSSVETMELFKDAFVLATPGPDTSKSRSPEIVRERLISIADLNAHHLLLLEEGHCLRDQALEYCKGATSQRAFGQRNAFGAASLATIAQMVANGYGATLLPELSLHREVRQGDLVLIQRFAEPEPNRKIGLAWRRSSQRKTDFLALADIIAECGKEITAATWRA